MKVTLKPEGSPRPDFIETKYVVYNPETGEQVFKREHDFNNQPNEKFNRIKKQDMKNYRS